MGEARCHWIRDKYGELHIPGCMGAAVYGPEMCTCDVPMSRSERAENLLRDQANHLDRLRERLFDLRATCANHQDRIRELSAENAVLRRRLAMIESVTG